jgi:hypothetical protein
MRRHMISRFPTITSAPFLTRFLNGWILNTAPGALTNSYSLPSLRMPRPIRVVRSLLPAFHAATRQRRGGLCSRWILIDLRRGLAYRVLSSRRRPEPYPPFYQPSIRSSLDLFNQSSLSLRSQSSLESAANSPFNHRSLKPLNLFNQSSVQSNPSLECFNRPRLETLNPST